MTTQKEVREALSSLLASPNLDKARELESALRRVETSEQILGRANQKSSIEAASESDRGFIERLANAFDASLTAARIAAGMTSTRELTPRACVEKLLCADKDIAEWRPIVDLENFTKPVVQVWLDEPSQKNRFRKFNPGDGLATVLVRDHGVGLLRSEMPSTILALNSESKLKTFEAIGQFGHGGSSALSFCESCLIITQSRSADDKETFSWTLVVCEEEPEHSKQQLVRKWFSDDDGFPLVGSCADYPELVDAFPGTSIWHFGFNRGGWISRIAGPSQKNPWGRIGRLLFSYPLPFELAGEIARTDTAKPRRPIEGAFYRLLKQYKGGKKDNSAKEIEYFSDEISESLVIDGHQYGDFSTYIFALKERSQVASYVDPQHPIILTFNGQNHGELTRTLFSDANLAELASSCIVEVRLDGLHDEALNEIVSNSREMPKNSVFTRSLKSALTKVISSDEMLRHLEDERQMDKAKKTSSGLSEKISKFLSAIISDAVAEPTATQGGSGPGTSNKGDGKTRTAKPLVQESDPPQILEFLSSSLEIAEGSTALAKFRCDARPPKYCFHGDNPRCFAHLEITGSQSRELKITGKREISPNGYGHIAIHCTENKSNPLHEAITAAKLVLVVQSTDGRLLRAELDVQVGPRSLEYQRKRRSDIQANIVFVASDDADVDELTGLLVEDNILPFSKASLLPRYADALEIREELTSYWGDKSEREGQSILNVEINAANPDLKKLLASCSSAEERVSIKEKYVRDIVLDCYQHCFKLEELPEQISEIVLTEPDDKSRAAELHLNHQKAIRIAYIEKQTQRQVAVK